MGATYLTLRMKKVTHHLIIDKYYTWPPSPSPSSAGKRGENEKAEKKKKQPLAGLRQEQLSEKASEKQKEKKRGTLHLPTAGNAQEARPQYVHICTVAACFPQWKSFLLFLPSSFIAECDIIQYEILGQIAMVVNQIISTLKSSQYRKENCYRKSLHLIWCTIIQY